MSARRKRKPALSLRPLVEEVEPRLLLSAGIEGALFSDAAHADVVLEHDGLLPPAVAAEPQTSSTSAAVGHTRQEVVFVDAATPDAARLIAALQVSADADGRQLEIIALDAGSGVAQISEALLARADLDAVHIVSHGSDGALQLGGERVDAAALERLAGTLRGWADALDADADILLYGCNLGASETGQAFVARFAELTGADVAASDDITGHAALGGDWQLEFRHGKVEASTLGDEQVQDAWRGSLAVFTFREGDSGYVGTQDTMLQQAAPTTQSGGSTQISVDLESSGSNSQEQALIRFDSIFGAGAGQIPLGSTIVSASLTIEGIDDASGATISLHRMLQAWSESDTWNSRVGGIQVDGVEAAVAADSTIVSPSPGTYSFTGLAATLQAWSNGDTNHGWALLSDSTAGWDIASSENGSVSIRPQLSVDWLPAGGQEISGTISEDVDGDGNLGDAVSVAGVDVHLYLDDGDGVIDAGDTLQASTSTDGAGLYSFANRPDGTYWVVVDSTTVAASAGYNGGFSDADVWAEQTYGTVGAVSFDGVYSYLGSAGVLYGGMQAEVADDASALTSAEHVTRAVVAGADVTAVDSAFSFSVVTRTGDGDIGPGNRTLQGSLRQFFGNSNAIAGTQSSLFAISTDDSNYNGTGNGEYTISLTPGWDGFLTDTVLLDATTQAGYAGTPIVELDVSGATGATAGIAVRANDSLVRGFSVYGSPDEGIEVDGSTGFGDNNTVQNNWVGLTVGGTAIGNADNGMLIAVDAVGNLYGGTGANDGNIVVASGSGGITIRASGANNNFVQGNYIGVAPDGLTAMPNVRGVVLMQGVSGNLIGGATAAARNVISGNFDHGVYIADAGTTLNVMQGNYIGLDATGTGPLGNQFDGVYVALDASNNTIGGSAPGEGNVISGNLDDGIEIGNSNTAGNAILGNFIGTNAAGTAPIANLRHGIVLYNGANNTQIGGSGANEGNLISGNGVDGIVIDGNLGATTINNTVQGNRIGTNDAGTARVANGNHGINLFDGASANLIGGAAAGEENVISGNGNVGLRISGTGTSNNVVQGNLIGTDINGTAGIGNDIFGLWILSGADNNTVGGSAAGEGNVVAANGGLGLAVTSADGTVIRGNFVGTDVGGTIDLGNLLSGVAIQGTASNTDVGGVNAGDGNVIANNGGAGVLIGNFAGTGISILRNSIFSNGELGIDIVEAGGLKGVTANDALDADGGANNQQNFPLLISSNTDAVGNVYVAGTMRAAASTTYRVEFFGSPVADASGHGQGQIYLGFADVTTDGSGEAEFSLALGTTLPADYVLSTTATAPDGSTSEFSANVDAKRMGVLTVDTSLDSVDGNVTSIVNLLNDRGADNRISLREAILATNATANAGAADEIHFNLQLDDPNRFYYRDDGTGGSLSLVVSTTLADADIGDFDPDYPAAAATWFRIQPTSALPGIDDALIIDGFTQSGASANTLAIGSDAVYKIVIDGDLSGNVDGFVINAAGSGLHGLVITGDFFNAIVVNADNVDVSGNYIGTDVTGSQAGNNLDRGVVFSGGTANGILGGSTPAARNVISGTLLEAVILTGATTNGITIEGNYIGTNAQGDAALANVADGIALYDGAYANVIRGNLISGNAAGVVVDGATSAPNNNTIAGNLIGTDAAGAFALANFAGIVLRAGASNTTIGGTSAADRNTISGNATMGISIDGAGTSGNVVLGNYIGTDAGGTAPLGNGGSGVSITGGASGNTIGGTAAGTRNVISGNTADGVRIEGAGTTGNTVLGNYIGTDASGTAAVANGSDGVQVRSSAHGNTIGGLAAGAGNVISGNVDDGIEISNSDNVSVYGNFVGAAADGVTAVGNGNDGIIVNAASGATIGTVGAGNVVVGNTDDGIQLLNADTVTIEGNRVSGNLDDGINIGSSNAVTVLSNLVGTAADGITAQGNVDDGIWVDASTSVIIGAAGAANVIAASGDSGIEIGNSAGAIIAGNFVGTDQTGTVNLGNGGSGIVLYGGSSGAMIGGTVAGDGNTVAFNTNNGVFLNFDAGTGNAILGNSIFSNGGLGIELTEAGPVYGVTANDAGDADAGANNQQNFPVLTSVVTNGVGTILIDGSLNSTASTSVRIEFFASVTADGSGHGEGEIYLGFVDVVTDGSGNATFSTTLTAAVPAGYAVSATATDAGNNTSEFGASFTAIAGNMAPVLTPASPVLPTITEDDTANGGVPVSTLLGASVSDADPGALEGIAITGLTSGNGTWQYSIDGGASWLDVGAVSGNSALLLRDSDLVRFVPDGQNADSASFTYRAWDQTSGTAGTLADTTSNGGSSAFSAATDSASITVTAVNDAPVLTPATPSLPTISEDDGANSGLQIGLLVGASVSDVDGGAVEGIALTGLSSGNGTWQYSLDGGTTWTDVGAVSNSSALLLRVTDFVRFVPDGQNADSASFTYRAWDQTSGTAGSLADTTTNGSTTAFSTATDTASITVTAVNDAPVLTPAAPSLPAITEDDVPNGGQQVGVLLGGSVSDVDSSAVEGIAITGLAAGNGTWQYSLDGGTTWTDVGAVANNSALLLRSTDFIRFVPDGENGDAASFTYRAWDQTTGAAGSLADTSTNGTITAFSTATDTASIAVTAINDAPVLTPAAPSMPTISEDDVANGGRQVSALLGASVSDVDSGATEGIAITGLASGNGTWQYSLDGGTSWLNVGAVANNSALLLRATDFIRFVPDGENADSASVTYRAWDRTSGSAGALADTTTNGNQSPFSVATDTASITVTAVNDAPVIAGLSGDSTTYTAGGGAILVEQGGDVLVSDVDSADFDTGDLTVAFFAGSDPAEDVLSIRDQGTGAGQIGFDGTSVTYGGVLIGTASGGSAGADLAIVFNANATTTAVAALIENITYENTDTVNPTTGARAVRFELRDGDGGAGASFDTTVNLPGVNTATILDRFGIEAYSNNDGTENWASNWIELDANGGGATGGRIEVRAGALDFQLESTGDNIYREANLANAISATLSFNYDNTIGNSAILHVEVSGDGGATYTTIAVFDASTNTGTGNQSIDISAFADTNTRVRFYVATGEAGGGNNKIWVDNVQIEYDYNTDPVFTLPGPAVNYTENDGSVVIDSLATVADAESTDFDGGVLTVDFTAGGTANDRLSVRDQGTGIGQVGVSGTDVTYEGVIVGTFSGGIDGSTPLTITFNTSADQAAVQAIARNITYENVSDDPITTARTVRFVLTDGDGGTSVAASETITLTATNDAPVLTPASPSLPAITEDDVANSGVQVSTLLGGSVSDVDGGAVEGIAMTGLSSGNGTWQYSLDGGTSWLNVGAVANNSALLLRSTDFLRFVPDGENADSASVTYRAWDQSAGAAGTLADTSTNGNQSPFSAATDTASITVTAVNDAPVLTPSAPSLPTITEDEVTNGGEPISALLGASVSDVDTGAVEGIAITGLSSGNGAWQYSLDGGTSWFNVGAVANNSALLLRATDFLRFVPDGENADSAAFTYRAWDQTTGAAGGLADTSPNGGQSAFSTATDNASIAVTAVNDAPVLTPAAPSLPSITEDDVANGGLQVGVLLGGSVSDIDSGAVQGIAITGLASGNGTWQYSLDGGATWLDVGAVANNSALLLRATDFIRFVPDGENADSASLTYRAWDQTSGSAGSLADTTANGGQTPFSTASDAASITVSAVNDAPVLTPASPSLPTITEDDVANSGLQIGLLLGASVTDVDSGAVEGIAITNLSSGNGTWQYSLDGGATWTDVGAVANNSALLLRSTDFIRFVPDGDNADAASFTYRAWDQTSGTAGALADATTSGGQSAFSTATDTASITVTAVNDAPVLTPASPSLPTISEDDLANGGQQVGVLLGGAVSDVDSGAVEGIAITGLGSGNGTWQYSLDGGTTWSDVGVVSDSSALLLGATDFIRFVPDGDNADAASFTFRAWDHTSGTAGSLADATTNGATTAFSTATDTASITVTAVNDAPVMTPASPTLTTISEDDVANGGRQVGVLLGASVSDVDSGAVEGIAITGLSSGNGTWQYSLDGGTTWSDVGVVANNSALLLRATDFIRFVPDGENGDAASFTYRAWDQTAGTAGSLADTTSNGGQSAYSTATDTASITVTAVNDAPVLTPASPALPAITEDDVANGGQQVGVLLGGAVSDVDTGALEGIAITGLSSGNGTWQYSLDGGATWTDVGVVSNSSALLLRSTDFIRFLPDGENADSASFTFRAWDQTSGTAGALADTSANGGQSAFSTATDTASITVTAVNDAPVLTPASPSLPTISEDDLANGGQQVGVILGASVSDIDSGAVDGIAITGLASGNGTWQYSLDGGTTWSDVGVVSDSSALLLRSTDFIRFVPDGENADAASFTYRAWDQTSGTAGSLADTTTNGTTTSFSTATDTASITVTTVNDAPVLTPASPALPTITEDDLANGGQQVGALIGGSVSDVDSGAVDGIAITGLASGNGTWQYSLDGGTTWADIGAVANNNALLLRATDFIRFVPDAQNADAASFSFRAWDQTSGSAGSLADTTTNGGLTPFSAVTDSASITVTALNDAPVLTLASPTLPSITEDEVANGGQQVSALLGASVSDVDAGAVEGIAITGLSSGNGTWQYSLDGGTTWTNVGAVSNSSALLLRATDVVRFVPDGQNADAASLTFRAWDQTSGSAGGLADTSANGGLTPFSAATDSASITVTAVNDAPVLAPASPTLPTITEDDVANSGQQVGALLGSSVSDVDAGAVEGVAITSLTSGNGTWQYSLDGGTTWISVGAVSNNSALLLRATDFIRFVPDGANADSASFTFRAWDQTGGTAGSLANTTVNGGSSPFSAATDSASITVTGINEAPVLTPAAPALPTVTEDDITNGGQQISALLGATVSDVDSGALEGIAITGLASGNGTWQYSLDGGTTWLDVGAVSNSSALLLRATDFIRFVPDAQNADAASFTYRAWDQTSGSAGGLADTSANGGLTPFSTVTDSASITVTAVNDAPVLTPASPTLPSITEDEVANSGQEVSALLGASVSDVDSGAAEGIAITGLSSGNGAWQFSLDGGTTWTDVGAVSNSSALLLRATDFIRFVPDAQNADAASFSFRAWDQTSGSAGSLADTSANGGLTPFSTATDSASITVTAVNDAPVLTPASPTLPSITEDEVANSGQQISILLGASVSDVDAGAVEGIAITGLSSGNGTWQYSLDGGTTWLDVGAVANNSALLLRATDVVRFVPDGQNADSASFTFRAWDQTSGSAGSLADTTTNGGLSPFSAATDSASITVTAVNDAPVLDASGGLALTSVAENDSDPAGDSVASLLASGGDRLTDVDSVALEGIAVIGVDDSNGSWQYSLDDGASWIAFGALDATAAVLLDAGDRIRFVPATDYEGGSAVTFLGWDQSAGSAGQTGVDTSGAGGISAFSAQTGTLVVDVFSTNDAPVASAVAPIVVDEDAAPTVLDLYSIFSDAQDADTALNYTVTANANPALFNAVSINPANGTLTLDYAANAFGTAIVTLRATDTAGAFVEVDLDVNVIAVNDLPTAADSTPILAEEDAVPLSVDLRALFDDIEDDVTGLSFAIVDNSDPSLLTATIDSATGQAWFAPVADANGTATITVRASDSDGGTVDLAVAVTLAAVNDAPTTTGLAAISVAEDAPPLVLALYPAFADIDDPVTALTFSVSGADGSPVNATLDPTSGTLRLDFAAHSNGTTTLTVRAIDAAGAFVDTSFEVNVAAVDDAPQVAVPGAQSANEGTVLVLSSAIGNVISLDDVDGGLATVTLSVANGLLTLATTDGLQFAVGSGGTAAAMTFTGTVADINAALDGLRFQSNGQFEGFVEVQVTAQAADAPATATSGRFGILVIADPDGLNADRQSVGNAEPDTDSEASAEPAAEPAAVAAEASAFVDLFDAYDTEASTLPAADRRAPTGPFEAQVFRSAVEALVTQVAGDSARTGEPVDSSLSDITRRLLALTAGNQPGVLVISDAVFDALDEFKQRLDSVGNDALSDSELIVTVASGVTLTLSAGFVTWLMRAGSLLTSLLSTTPVWRGFDPLPILGAGRGEDDDDFFLDLPENSDDAEALFDNVGTEQQQ